MAPKARYTDGEKVLCYHGPLLYEAKCLKSEVIEKHMKYFIHYSGWNKNWDEWVSDSRVLKYNETNLQKQKELNMIHVKSKKSKSIRLEPKDTYETSPISKPEKHPAPSTKTVKIKEEPKETASELTPTEKPRSKPEKPRSKPVEPRSKPVQPKPKPVKPRQKQPAKPRQKQPAKPRQKQPAKPRQKQPAKPRQKQPAKPRQKQPAKPRQKPEKRPAPSSALEPSGSSNESKKRKTSEPECQEDVPPIPDTKITIPSIVKDWIIDDWDLVTRQKKILHLPARVTVEHIFANFIKEKVDKGLTETVEKRIIKFVDVIRGFFNTALGKVLLYKFERPAYADILAEYPDRNMSEIYGTIHLLRMMSKMEDWCTELPCNPMDRNATIERMQNMTDFIAQNPSYFSLNDYVVAAPEYHRRAL